MIANRRIAHPYDRSAVCWVGRRCGTRQQHTTALGLDVAGMRERIGAFANEPPHGAHTVVLGWNWLQANQKD